MVGPGARHRVVVVHYKPCIDSNNLSDMLKYLPVGWTRYVQNKFAAKYPPYRVTTDEASAPFHQLEVQQISGHRTIRGRRTVITVMYETRWKGVL